MSLFLLFAIACSGSGENQPEKVKQPVQPQTRNSPSGPKGPPPNHMNQQKKSFHLQPDFQFSSSASDDLKSILLISLDTVRADRLEVYGGRAETPNLNVFASKGVLFEQAISHFPETALSHWTMLTGVLPEVHGNVPANGGSVYKGPNLAEIAKKHGYDTGAFIGGVTMQDSACGMKRGFDLYDDQFRFSMEDMSRPGAQVTENALKWIKARKAPYFAFVHYFDAHFPYTPDPSWIQKYDPDYKGSVNGTDKSLRPYRDGEKTPSARDVEHVLALYDGELSELDIKIAPLLQAVGPDTVVVITSDHGESFEHGYYFNHRAGLWDGVTRVPLLIRAPDLPSNLKISSQVGLMDVTPTVLELAGLPLDRRMQGKSLLSLVKGTDSGREQVYSITDPWMPDPQFAVRSLGWKWISRESGDLIYNLTEDPNEEKNLNQIPSLFSSSKTTYSSLMDSLKSWQSSPPKARIISDQECKRLEALGYTTCSKKPMHPPPPRR